MTTAQELEAAYRQGRWQARGATTVRLRLVERRLGRQEDYLSRTERAFLDGIRAEMRDRGVEGTPGLQRLACHVETAIAAADNARAQRDS